MSGVTTASLSRRSLGRTWHAREEAGKPGRDNKTLCIFTAASASDAISDGAEIYVVGRLPSGREMQDHALLADASELSLEQSGTGRLFSWDGSLPQQNGGAHKVRHMLMRHSDGNSGPNLTAKVTA